MRSPLWRRSTMRASVTSKTRPADMMASAESHPQPTYVRRVGDQVGAPLRRVLIALQEAGAAGRLAKRFSESRVVPTLAFTCKQLTKEAREGQYTLIVMDEGFCRHDARCLDEVRASSGAPILALADLEEDELAGVALALGPPLQPTEVARKGTALIDMSRPVALPHPIRWRGLELDMRTHQARWNGRSLSLTTLQFRIMEILVLAAGGLVTTEQLSRRVWGESSFIDDERLVAHVRRIRKLIECDPSRPEFLLRVRGRGFRLSEESQQS